eukprot:11485743-Karenia_brevis.AAC.1
MLAAKIRFARKHFSFVSELHSKLLNSFYHLPVLRASESVDGLSHPLWEWPSFVCTLVDTWSGKGMQLGDGTLVGLRAELAGVSGEGGGRSRVQKAAYSYLLKHARLTNCCALMESRLVERCAPLPVGVIIDWGSVFHPFGQNFQHFAFQLVRTFLNAWSTASRTSQQEAHCIFCGTQGQDSFTHLLQCDVLWRAISCNIPFFSAYFDEWQLLGLSPMSKYQLFGVVVACLVYHSYHHMGSVPDATLKRGILVQAQGLPQYKILLRSYYRDTVQTCPSQG